MDQNFIPLDKIIVCKTSFIQNCILWNQVMLIWIHVMCYIPSPNFILREINAVRSTELGLEGQHYDICSIGQ